MGHRQVKNCHQHPSTGWLKKPAAQRKMSFSIIPKRLPILYSIFFHVNNPVPETLFFCRIHKFTQQKSPPGELRRGHSNNEQPAKGLTTGHVDVAI